MKSTSRGSRLVSSAARSPGRSSTGPEVWRRFTPISRAMMCASVVLPSPGGPNSSTWSSASPRARAAWMKISSCARIFSWPTYSARVAGRSARSISPSCAEAGVPAISRSVSTPMRAFCQTRRTPKEKRRHTAAFSLYWKSLLKAEQDADAHHVHVELVEVAGLDIAVPLPLRPHAEVAREVVARAETEGQVDIVVGIGRGSESLEGDLDIGVRHIQANLPKEREALGQR